jgi:hypothetical protein
MCGWRESGLWRTRCIRNLCPASGDFASSQQKADAKGFRDGQRGYWEIVS